MDEIIGKIIAEKRPITRADVAELLASVGEPGKKRGTKEKAVKKLYDQAGIRGQSFQNFAVWDSLEDYEAW